MGQCNDYFHIELRSFFSITNKNTLTRPANCKKTTVHHIFQKNIKVSDFGLIWRSFREYLQIKNYFQKSGSVTFLPLYSPNRKILRAVSEKTALPTNKLLPTTPILQNLADAGPKKFKSLQVFHCFHRLFTKLLLPRLQNLQQQIVLNFQIDQQK